MIKVVVPAVNRWPETKSLRLRALKNAVDAFAETYESALSLPDSKWQERLLVAQTAEKVVTVFAEDDKKLIGMVGAVINAQANSANVFGMYVDADYRGQGIGDMLLTELLARLKKRQIKSVDLEVNPGLKPAVELYLKHGFKATGEKLMSTGDRFPIIVMELKLS